MKIIMLFFLFAFCIIALQTSCNNETKLTTTVETKKFNISDYPEIQHIWDQIDEGIENGVNPLYDTPTRGDFIGNYAQKKQTVVGGDTITSYIGQVGKKVFVWNTRVGYVASETEASKEEILSLELKGKTMPLYEFMDKLLE